MAKFFTADLHLGHEKIAHVRGFKFCVDHDDYLIDQINQKVTRTDDLYLLGDFGFRPCKYRPRIKCRHIHFVIGNHDKPSECQQVFGTVHKIISTKVSGGRVYMCHFPMAFWENSHNGSAHVYGHCHSSREATLDQCFPGRRSMDVGVDNAKKLKGDWRPFTEGDVEELFLRPGHDHVAFYDELRANEQGHSN